MTRWAFIADVHGNLRMLERAIASCRERGAERFVFLGDLLGRGDPEGCVRLVRATASLSVVGNRDLDWADRAAVAAREYVLTLPREAEADDFLAVHGDERLTPGLGSGQIRRDFERTYRILVERGQRLLFFGHTHHARVWRKDGPGAPSELLRQERVELRGGDGAAFLVNVGTTGLPFPGKGPPACTVYDDVERWVDQVVLGTGRGKVRELEA